MHEEHPVTRYSCTEARSECVGRRNSVIADGTGVKGGGSGTLRVSRGSWRGCELTFGLFLPSLFLSLFSDSLSSSTTYFICYHVAMAGDVIECIVSDMKPTAHVYCKAHNNGTVKSNKNFHLIKQSAN